MSLLSIEKLPQPPIPLPTPLPSVTGMDSLIEIFDLPIEILQIVGRSCNDAKDFVNLLCTCKRMYHAIGGSNSGVWTHFFKNKFDKPKQLTNQRAHTILTALKSKRHRVDLFKRPIKVSSQHTQSSAVNVHFNMKSMLQLVAEAFVEVPIGGMSKTLEYLQECMFSSGCLERIMKDQNRTTELKLLQLIFFACAIDPDRKHETWAFPMSQKMAYANSEKYPLFTGPRLFQVNYTAVLCILNFFKYHLCTKDEALQTCFSSLPRIYQPRLFDRQLSPGAHSLGRDWKGSQGIATAFSEIYSIRSLPSYLLTQANMFDEETTRDGSGFSDLTLSFDRSLQATGHWPAAAIAELDPLRCSNHEGSIKPFVGAAHDRYEYLAVGTVSPLASVAGIHGWMRFTMVKYLDPMPEDTTANIYLAGELANRDYKVRASMLNKDTCAAKCDEDADDDYDTNLAGDIRLHAAQQRSAAREHILATERRLLERDMPASSDTRKLGTRAARRQSMEPSPANTAAAVSTSVSATSAGCASPIPSPPSASTFLNVRAAAGLEIANARIENLAHDRRGAVEAEWRPVVLHEDLDLDDNGFNVDDMQGVAVAAARGASTGDAITTGGDGTTGGDQTTIADEYQRETWFYEGVVLPGGKLIAGRWWQPLEAPPPSRYAQMTGVDGRNLRRRVTGPFLYWCIDN